MEQQSNNAIIWSSRWYLQNYGHRMVLFRSHFTKQLARSIVRDMGINTGPLLLRLITLPSLLLPVVLSIYNRQPVFILLLRTDRKKILMLRWKCVRVMVRESVSCSTTSVASPAPKNRGRHHR